MKQLRQYLEHIKRFKSENTYKTYNAVLSEFPYSEVTIDTINSSIDNWKQKNLSRNTIYLKLSAIKSYLVYSKLATDDLLQLISSYKPEKKIPIITTANNIEKIVDTKSHTQKIGPKYKLLMLLLYQCALRISEAINIDLSDVFDEYILIRNTKSSRDRVVPITIDIKDTLSTYLKVRQNTSPALFTTSNGRLSIRSAQTVIKNRCKENSLEELTCHKFRHSGLSNLLDNNVDLGTIRDLAGHSNLATTSIYLHVSPEKMMKKIKQVYG